MKSRHKKLALIGGALAIIGIAHPRFRDDLLREAENMFLL